MLSRKIIQNEAERIAKEHGFTRLPVDPFKIAAELDIMVEGKPAEAEGVSGMFLKVGDAFGILYGTHIGSEGFQRFSVAHELGHYFLEGHVDAVLKLGPHASRAGFQSDDKYEREADLFASSLLMPEDAFKKALQAAGSGLSAIESLAQSAKTSLTSTAFRYHELTRDAVAVVLATNGAVDVCFYSDRFKDLAKSSGRLPFFRRGTPLPHGTVTQRFHDDQRNIRNGASDEGTTPFADWFDLDNGFTLHEEVRGLGSYGKSLSIISCAVSDDDSFDIDDEVDSDEFLRERWSVKFTSRAWALTVPVGIGDHRPA